jgi:hypothetical protein
MGWMTGVQFLAGAMMGFSPFTATSRLVLTPTQPLVQWVPGALTPAIKQPGHEADHSPPFSAESKNVWCSTSNPPIHCYSMVLT